MSRALPLAVVAVGGNALARRGEPITWEVQAANAARAAAALAAAAAHHRLVITHGNGPQVGLLASQTERDPDTRLPLAALDAETEGAIGHLLVLALGAELAAAPVVAVVTHVEVDQGDPAFAAPSKPVGPVLGEAEAVLAQQERGWVVAADGPGWRRVVPSPQPLGVLERGPIALLADAGCVVVCGGGGGVPVARLPGGGLRSVDAVIDKDLTSALLAVELGADRLVLLTDVDAVYRGWGTPVAAPIRTIEVGTVRALGEASPFAAGSMGPKVEAACRFVEATGRPAAIGALDDAAAVLAGLAGTTVVPR